MKWTKQKFNANNTILLLENITNTAYSILQHFVYISDFQTKDISIKPKNLIPNNPSLNS